MKYEYKCDKCKSKMIINQSMSLPLPRDLPCENCGKGIMNQDFKNKVGSLSVKTPESFKLNSDYAPIYMEKTESSQILEEMM